MAEGKKKAKKLVERFLVSASLEMRHNVSEVRETANRIKEGVAELSSSFTIADRPIVQKILGQIQADIEVLFKGLATIEEQTRPQTWTQKIADTIFSSVLGWIISIILGLFILLLFGLRLADCI